jgi:hypothetical protein
MTEDLIVPLRPSGVGRPAAIDDVDPAFAQIAAEWLRYERAQRVERDRIAPHRPGEPVGALELVKARCPQPASDREAWEERERLTREEDRGANRSVVGVVRRFLSAESMQALSLWIPPQ